MALLLLLTASALSAQGITILAEAGVGGQVLSPATEARIAIIKHEAAPFVGRLVLDFSLADRGGMIQLERRVIQDIHLEEGSVQRSLRISVPANSSSRDCRVLLERQVAAGVYELAAETHLSAPVSGSSIRAQRKLAGFVSSARLTLAQPWMFYDLVEIPPAELPESWKALAGFEFIVLNDDRLTRAQAGALLDYVTMGGKLIVSPTSAATFNPETPAGKLLGIAPTTRPASHQLGDFDPLRRGPTDAGTNLEQTNVEQLPVPAADEPFALWPEHGNARPVAEARRLISRMPVGAGTLVLMHVNISEAPFHYDRPTSACVNMLLLAIDATQDSAASPLAALATTDVRNRLDIASRRIPNRDILVLLLLVYIAVAGVGMFLLARRIRRPELYPAALLAAAVASVVLVFGVGELAKRGGNRVQTARLLVSDATSDRAALFTAGCSYAVEGKSLTYRHAPEALFLPSSSSLRPRPSWRGFDDELAYEVQVAPSEIVTGLIDLQRWQNVFFLHNAPRVQRENRIRVDSLEGAWRVTNVSPHRLRACIFVVSSADAGEDRSCDWYFAPALDAEGDTVTFSRSMRIEGEYDAQALAQMMTGAADSHEFNVYADLLRIHPEDRLNGLLWLKHVEGLLHSAALLPPEGGYTLLSLLPPNALPPSDIGADVEDSRIGQVNLWAVRGMLDVR